MSLKWEGKLFRDRLSRVFNFPSLTGWGGLINYWVSKIEFFIVVQRFHCSYEVKVSSVISINWPLFTFLDT